MANYLYMGDTASKLVPSEESTAEALFNDLILESIFKYLRVKDLLHCRLLNEKWKHIATSALRSRPIYINNAKLVSRTSAGRLDEGGLEKKIADLKRCINNSSGLFTSFGVRISAVSCYASVWSLKSAPVKKFLEEYGDRVVTVELNAAFESTMELTELFAKYIRNVEQVDVGNVSFLGLFRVAEDDPKPLHLQGYRVSLPRLKRIKFSSQIYCCVQSKTIEFCEELIQTASALTRVENYPSILSLEPFVSANKLDTLRSMRLHRHADPADYHDMLRRHPPQLTSLVLLQNVSCPRAINTNTSEYFVRAAACLLASSQDSLQQLRANNLSFLKGESTLAFKRLRRLELSRDLAKADNPDLIFPPTWRLSSTFPALKTVTLELTSCTKLTASRFFGSEATPVQTVSKLELRCPFDDIGLEHLVKVFPNTTCLEVDWQKCFGLPGSGSPALLWNIPLAVEILKIRAVQLRYHEDEILMDSFFTGIRASQCRKLRGMRNPPPACEIVRDYPSMLNLKSLKRLYVSYMFVGKVLREPVIKNGPFVSGVSVKYAFAMMPGLQTYFLYDFYAESAPVMAEGLEPATPCVTFVHEDLEEKM